MTPALPDEHFFRRESGRLVSTLTRMLGVHHLALAEDAVQETLAAAVEVWAFRGRAGQSLGVADDRGPQPRASACSAASAPRDRFAPEIGRLADAEGAAPARSPRWRTCRPRSGTTSCG